MERWPYDVDAERFLKAMSNSPLDPASAPHPMEQWFLRWDRPRKWLLFSCACARHAWDRLPDPSCQEALLLAERYAEGEPVEHQLAAVEGQVRKIGHALQRVACDSRWGAGMATLALCRIRRGPLDRYCADFVSGTTAVAVADNGNINREVLASLCALLQDVFGVAAWSGHVDPRWLTWNAGVVLGIARGIYEERAFDRMPILADALEEAGCLDGEILAHYRQSQEHVRGCWPLELLLAKE